MTNITATLAEALRAVLDAPDPCDCGIQGCGRTDCPVERCNAATDKARAALAEYEAAPTGPYTAETFAVANTGENGYCIKLGDDTICDVWTGKAGVDRIVAALNAVAVQP